MEKVNQTEPFSDDKRPAVAEDLPDLFRGGGRGKVVILGGAVQQKVADGASDDIGLEAGLLELCDNIGDVGENFFFDVHDFNINKVFE